MDQGAVGQHPFQVYTRKGKNSKEQLKSVQVNLLASNNEDTNKNIEECEVRIIEEGEDKTIDQVLE